MGAPIRRSEPSQQAEGTIRRDGRAAAQLLQDLVQRDPRLGQLLDEIGFDFDYLYEYGMGAAKIGAIGTDGRITLT